MSDVSHTPLPSAAQQSAVRAPATGEFPFAAPAARVMDDSGRTVLKSASELVVASHDDFSVSGIDAVLPSGIWRRLFPGDAEREPGAVVEAPAGCELGHFTVDERIGSGGMGAVFRALDNRLQRVVALKVLSPGQSRDDSSVLRFQNEARAAARLDHENIARVFYVGEDRGLYFIAFEYVIGQNVRDLIRQAGRLDVTDAVNYTLQIAAALRHTTAAGVVHRDIKPSNIIITPGGRAKLVDLGLARKTTPENEGDLTVVGTTLGTFDYISPEQARDPRAVDVRSDIYSLGCTLYHMLAGQPPYSSGTMVQKLLDHQNKQAPDLRTVNAKVPPALAAVCRKMMAADPNARYSTPAELMRDLLRIGNLLGLRPAPVDGLVWSRPVPPTPPAVRSGMIWAGSALAVLLVALLVDRLPISRGDAESPETFAQNELVLNRVPRATVFGEQGGASEPESTSRNSAEMSRPGMRVAQGSTASTDWPTLPARANSPKDGTVISGAATEPPAGAESADPRQIAAAEVGQLAPHAAELPLRNGAVGPQPARPAGGRIVANSGSTVATGATSDAGSLVATNAIANDSADAPVTPPTLYPLELAVTALQSFWPLELLDPANLPSVTAEPATDVTVADPSVTAADPSADGIGRPDGGRSVTADTTAETERAALTTTSSAGTGLASAGTGATSAATTPAVTAEETNLIVGDPATGPAESFTPAANVADAPVRLLTAAGELRRYTSLSAAVTDAAGRGDVIELLYDGLPPELDGVRPLQVDRKSLTIRAGKASDGRTYRPLVNFQSDQFKVGETAAITLTGGQLALQNVDLRMTISGHSEGWALFALPGGEAVRLTDVNITLVNPSGYPLSVFNLRTPPSVSPQMALMMGRDTSDGFDIRINRCLIRGSAGLVTVAHTLPGRIAVEQSALALREAVLNVTGGVDRLADEVIAVEMDHVTAVLGDALLRLEVGSLESLPIAITARNSVFAAMVPGPLVLMSGRGNSAELMADLTWSGLRNAYDPVFLPFWSIVTPEGAAVTAPATFESWKQHWNKPGFGRTQELSTETVQIPWATDQWRRKPLPELTGTDLELAPADGSIIAGTDGRSVGVATDRLPPRADPPGPFNAQRRTPGWR